MKYIGKRIVVCVLAICMCILMTGCTSPPTVEEARENLTSLYGKTQYKILSFKKTGGEKEKDFYIFYFEAKLKCLKEIWVSGEIYEQGDEFTIQGTQKYQKTRSGEWVFMQMNTKKI